MFKSILILLQPSCEASHGKVEKVSFFRRSFALSLRACNVAYLHFEWHTMRNGVGWITLQHFCNARPLKLLIAASPSFIVYPCVVCLHKATVGSILVVFVNEEL